MSYSIAVQIFQTNPAKPLFHLAEKTVWSQGIWSEADGDQTLLMEVSGTSGTLRFITPNKSEIVVLALGVHNYKRWGDIVTNDQKTGLQINGEYYNSGFRASAREAQLAEYSVKNAQGRNFQLKYVEPNGNNLKVQFIIG